MAVLLAAGLLTLFFLCLTGCAVFQPLISSSEPAATAPQPNTNAVHDPAPAPAIHEEKLVSAPAQPAPVSAPVPAPKPAETHLAAAPAKGAERLAMPAPPAAQHIEPEPIQAPKQAKPLSTKPAVAKSAVVETAGHPAPSAPGQILIFKGPPREPPSRFAGKNLMGGAAAALLLLMVFIWVQRLRAKRPPPAPSFAAAALKSDTMLLSINEVADLPERLGPQIKPFPAHSPPASPAPSGTPPQPTVAKPEAVNGSPKPVTAPVEAKFAAMLAQEKQASALLEKKKTSITPSEPPPPASEPAAPLLEPEHAAAT